MAKARKKLAGRRGQGKAGAAPEAGQLVTPATSDPGELFSGDPTPQRVLSILRTAAYGDPSRQNTLFDTMLETDGHLASVHNQRHTALTGKDWELLPANQVGKSPRIDETLAQQAQEHCQEIIAEMRGWETSLCHLNEAIGRGTAVVEVVWDLDGGALRPVAMVPVPFSQVIGDRLDASRLRVLLSDEDHEGIPIDEQPPGKFVVHTPKVLGGNRFRGGLLRAAAFGYMVKRHGRKWWMIGLELFGLPMTILKYPTNADDKLKAEMKKMIRDLGIARGGIFPVGSEVDLIESSKSGGGQFPHERLLAFIDAGFSKLFVGQTLTTEIGETGGARAAAQVHDDVRNDLTEDDARKEGATIREQLLIPLVVHEFGPDAAIAAPYFSRVIEEERDLKDVSLLLSTAVNDLGAQVPASVVEDELGIKLADPNDRDKPLPGRATGFDPFGGNPAAPGAVAASARLVPHRHLASIVSRRRSTLGAVGSWVLSAVLASQAHSQDIISQFSAIIEQAPSSPAALSLLADRFSQLPTEDMVELQRQFILAAELHGRWTTHQQVQAQRHTNKDAAATMLVANAARIDFEPMPFIEAIESLRDRVGLDPETFENLEREARSRAWRIAGVWNMDLLAMAHRELLASIEAGETSRDFRLRLPDMAERKGWFGENPWHADVVHFQNFTMAHAAGRYRQYAEADIGHWRFVASGDSCPICEPFIGRVFSLDDRRVWPPLHFYCDCSDEVVFDEELQPDEAIDSRRVDAPQFEIERTRQGGFAWDVANYAALEPLALSRFPEELRPLFRQFAEAQGWEVVG